MNTGGDINEALPLCSNDTINMDCIVAYLDGQSPDVELGAGTLTGCGPFLQRLLRAARETHTADRLDDVLHRVATHFDRCSHITPNENTAEFIADIAVKASGIVLEEVLLLLPPPRDASAPLSRAAQIVWARVGQLVVQLVRDSTAGAAGANVNRDNCRRNSISFLASNPTSETNKGAENINYDHRTVQRASPLLLQQIPWKIDWDGEKERSAEDGSAMVSGFTVLWGSIFSFLQLLAKGSTELKTQDEKSADASLRLPTMSIPQPQHHPLGTILADCVVTMIERNRSLLWEAHEMNQHGAAAEVLCVTANNFAWLLQQCKQLPMVGALEIKELIMQCIADLLQDIVTGCSEELHYIFSLYLFPLQDGRQRPQVTTRVLTGRLSTTRYICNSLAYVLPRSEVMSLLLERLLLPLAERLLDTRERHHVVENSGVICQRVGQTHTLCDDDTVLPSPLAEDTAITLTQRVTEVLNVLASDSAFGSTICQQSSSYCTISRLLPVMTS